MRSSSMNSFHDVSIILVTSTHPHGEGVVDVRCDVHSDPLRNSHLPSSFLVTQPHTAMASPCLIPSNPDIAGIGVRIAIYAQNLLSFIPAAWAIWDAEVTDYELESVETQSTTNLILAFAILISCVVQAFTLGLTNYHASIVLSMSWTNNTNVFIYFLLYVHYKAKDGPGRTPVKPQWSAWLSHLKARSRAVLHLPDGGSKPCYSRPKLY